MTRAALIRLLLAAVLALAGIDTAPAQSTAPPSHPFPGPGPMSAPDSGGSDSRVLWYVLGGIAIAVIGLLIAQQANSDPAPPPDATPPPQPPPPPPPPRLVQHTTAQPGPARGARAPASRALRNGFNQPPPGVTAYVANEVIVDIPSSVPVSVLDAIAARHGMTRLETVRLQLTGRTLHRWRLGTDNTVPQAIQSLSAGERRIAGAQPNYLYALQQQAGTLPSNADQYAPQKLHLTEAHRLATGSRVLVAVIDSSIDATHPDLQGAIAARFDAAPEEKPHSHGTGMAGAIAGRHAMLGVAPRVGLLAVQAFGTRANTAEGTTFNILKGLDWAATQGARVVNMSFAGPSDPRLLDALAKASRKGMVLIAAAGNAGPKSPPLFPAADPHVIAVTATDVDDAVFGGAVRGKHVAVAAPGVDVFVPAPDGAYQFTTGTSVAAAEVSGVVALLLERNPALTPAQVRAILTRTAKDLGSKGTDAVFGAGLVDAANAVTGAGGM